MISSRTIGISGGSGSGKTTLAKALVERLKGRALLLSHDRYYFHMPCGNYDTPDALDTALMLSHLDSLQSGHAAELPIYDEVHSRRKTETEWVQPYEIIVVEGIFVFSVSEIRRQLDFSIYVETPEKERLQRRVIRDSQEKLRAKSSIIKEWHSNVMPTHQSQVEKGAEIADLIVSGQGQTREAVTQILSQFDWSHD
ncbi:Uridine kinase [Acaryochloris thomasi RCC1774]|uniref:Uridine kinase n=1 Tax=Acaryochloris thomasi RCC1774 TaxID=1764569 RepID=A0A2W1JEQ8_9CYAN|nr:AAA family ATPase [Acaryochloris thomasi]PZD70225.1 Uridine kinase [Acaryochloris thomasi RCC1774]